jgi:hypothetical protein
VPYSYLTYAAAVPILASRLQDPNQVYWNQPDELLNCVIEAARFFQSMTGSYKTKFVFQTTANNPYYDLPNLTGSPVSYNATDVEVANNVLAALLEPPLPATGLWQGTGQFTFNQLQQALQNRLNRFISETGCRVNQRLTAGPAPPADLIPLPDGTTDLRRAAWVPTPLIPVDYPPVYALGRLDDWAIQAYSPDALQNPGQPIAYSLFQTEPQQLRVTPPPLSTGQIDCLLVSSGSYLALSVAAPTILQIPDDLSPALKWGTLADLLGSDGPSRDYERASYCEQRYQEFVQLASLYPSVLTCDINNITCGQGSVFDLDFYQPDWQQATGQPGFVGMCGRNMACVGQVPDGVYGVGMWLSANTPIDGYIQVSRGQIDPLLDYAQHIASFKMAGAEFNGTARMFDNIVACAKGQNSRLDAVSFYRSQVEQPARKSEMELPRMIS